MNIHFRFEEHRMGENIFVTFCFCTLRDSNEREIATESKKLRLQKGLIYPNSKLPAHRYTILYRKNQEKCKIWCTGVPYLSLIHISEPTRLGMISYAVFCLKKKKKIQPINIKKLEDKIKQYTVKKSI